MRLKEEHLDIDEMIKNLNDEQKKNLIKHRLDYRLNTDDLLRISTSINDENIKKEIIKDYDSFNVRKYEMIEIVKSLKKQSIIEIVHNHINYSLTVDDIIEIINIVDDDSLKKEVITNYKDYYLDKKDISKICASIKDITYKKDFIIQNRFDLDSENLSTIIGSVNDDNYKYAIVTNYKEFNLKPDDVAYILSTFEKNNKNNRYLLELLTNKEYYNLDKEVITSIVQLIDADSIKKSIILKNINIFPIELLYKMISSLNSKEESYEIINKMYDEGIIRSKEVHDHLMIPDGLSVGIEIETEGKNSEILKHNVMIDGWEGVMDSTLNRGIEVVSPILNNNDEESILKACALLDKLNQETSKNCAGHIHFGADYLENDVNSFKALLEIFTNMEEVLYLISNPEGDVPREKIFKYSSPITYKVKKEIANNKINFKSIKNMKSFITKVQKMQESRYSSINFKNLGDPDKNTIEFRTPNGSIDPNIWIENINLFGNIIKLAKRISAIKRKSYLNMSNSDKLIYYYYEIICDSNTNDKEKLIALLSTFPKEIDKKVYLNRYDTNKALIQGLATEEILEAVSALRPIRITTCSETLKRKIKENYKKNYGLETNNKTR